MWRKVPLASGIVAPLLYRHDRGDPIRRLQPHLACQRFDPKKTPRFYSDPGISLPRALHVDHADAPALRDQAARRARGSRLSER